MDAQTRHKLNDLIDRALEGDDLTAAQQEDLRRLLSDSQEARQCYLAASQLHADIAWTLQTGGIEQHLRPSPPETAAGGAPAWRWRAAAGIALVLVGLMGWLAGRGNDRPAAVAHVASSEAAIWSQEHRPVRDGEVELGLLGLDQGSAKLILDAGAEMTIWGPASLEFLDPKAVRLVRGRVAVRVHQQGVGFRVLTDTADLVDLGTEFGVSVDDAGATEVHVSDGIVVARSLMRDSVAPILGQEAARIGSGDGELAAVSFDAARFPSFKHSHKPQQIAVTSQRLLPDGARVLFLGDRLTSYETHLLMLVQAFAALPPDERPKLYNLGMKFPLLWSEEDFAQMIEPLRPTHAILEFGSEVAVAKPPRTPQQFRGDIERMVARLKAAGIQPIIETGHPLGRRHAQAQAKLDQFNQILRDIARRESCPLIDIDMIFRRSSHEPDHWMAERGYLLTTDGSRLVAGGILAALGYGDLQVPERLRTAMLPGVIENWHYMFREKDSLLTAEGAARLHPDGSSHWHALTLPQPMDDLSRRMPNLWSSMTYRERARGFATNLNHDGRRDFVAVTYLQAAEPRDVVFNTGGQLAAIWLNGREIFRREGWAGQHPGRERLRVHLPAGRNHLVIESRDSFYLGVTDRIDWPLPTPKLPEGE